ncbi:MAG: class I SAM-dependent methyltransferase [Nitrospirae bacterium]|nr:class I SAM-dependent methyltransferase [Nitrospirota bacterium]
MGRLLDIITPLHTKTVRDYLARMTDDKVSCMKVARRYDRDFWDGHRRYGYGGYRYDGRWRQVAAALIKTYNLPDNAQILDVGCGKGFLLYEFKQLLPECTVTGFDISQYAIDNAKEEIRPCLSIHNAAVPYPYGDREFDLVISITTLHNLPVYALKNALREIERVGKNKYVAVESYDSEEQLFNLQCWALTCESFYKTREWIWIYNEFGYTGDYEFIYFD